jgi:hypothetical protein
VILTTALASCGSGFKLDDLRLQLSAQRSSSDQGDSLIYAGALNASLKNTGKSLNQEIVISSNYARNQDTTTTDFLQLDYRATYKNPSTKFQKLLLIQTQGTNNFSIMNTLLAAGAQVDIKYGYVAATLGMSKDIRTANPWKSDVGLSFKYNRKMGKRWDFSTSPSAHVDVLGETHLVGGKKIIYTLDARVNYRVSDQLGVGYTFLHTQDPKNTTQWIGLTYSLK